MNAIEIRQLLDELDRIVIEYKADPYHSVDELPQRRFRAKLDVPADLARKLQAEPGHFRPNLLTGWGETRKKALSDLRASIEAAFERRARQQRQKEIFANPLSREVISRPDGKTTVSTITRNPSPEEIA